MPINKSARYRFEIIDECLRNPKRRWSKRELLKYVNRRLELHFGNDVSISVSQLRYDLESMQSEYGAPIEMYREGRSYFYRYDDPSFSLKELPVDEEDLAKLNTAVSLLQQIKGFTIADEIAEIVTKLENRYKFSNADGNPVILFENAPSVHGIENLEDIYHAIMRRTPLKICYQPFTSDVSRERIVHPYLLKEYDNRWYLFGYCLDKNGLGTFALDRMTDIRVSNQPYVDNTVLDVQTYFDDIVGVTKPAKESIEQIDLMFTERYAPYILTKPIHKSQVVMEKYEHGSIHVRIHVIINPELVTLLLSFGMNVKVLSPEKLSVQIHAAARMLLDHYE